MEKIIDLHVHSNFSDGFDNIETVIRKAKNNNVGAISLVEHYNISSFKIAKEYAKEDMLVIPGIEIGTDMSFLGVPGKHVCHILGYYVSYDISKVLDEYEIDRATCVAETLKILNRLGISITIEDVLKYARDKNSVGRFDIAIALKRMGYVKSKNEAYGIYLDHGGKSYVKRNKLNPFELTKKIRECGGVPVLAHPKSLRFHDLDEEDFIKKLANNGLCGIEVYNPHNSDKRRQKYLDLCSKFNLIYTVGSDYHGGKRKPVIEIGKGINNNLNITDMSIIENLKEKKKEIDRIG